MPADRSDGDARPSPDALLEDARRESRGRLKIFLGAAPGVGKTYEMLQSGRARRAEGVDVVIGIVETHGRKETEALVTGLEVVARRHVEYKGRTLQEMDLDALLTRAPSLALVDELAHSNAPGSRHPKRYLDVQELLSRGIDVHTTLNIQHVESLNDVVASITRIRVRETVPDSIIDQADEVEIIDLTPGDLIRRLREGKVYLPATARSAVENYFSPGNLTALRELALRRTAQRVDDQLVSHMQAHAIAGPWAAGERVLVCVDTSPGSAALVRYARRQAERLRAPWAAIHVETAEAASASETAKDRLTASLRLAEQLGGEAVTLPGRDLVEEIIRYASANNFTHLVLGSPRPRQWWQAFRRSLVNELIKHAGGVNIHVVALPEEAVRQTPDAAGRRAPDFKLGPYLVSAVLVGAAIAIGAVLDRVLDVQNIALVFLMAVLTAAMTVGLWPALLASGLSALAFNFFFLEPRYTLRIGDPDSVLALGFFLVVAVTASNLAAGVQRQAVAARQRARTTEDLYLFSKKLAGTGTLDDVLWATAYQIASMLKVRVVLLLPEGDGIAVKAGYPPDDTLDEADIAAARWTWEHNRAAGRGADTLPGAKRLYLPLRTGRRPIGVAGLDSDRQGPLLTPEQQRLFDALADQAAIAIERIELVADVDRNKLAAEADRLRSALLTSISHDLKTPLAAIMGAGSALRDYGDSLGEADKAELLSTVVDEGERLNRFIANLLDMTRLGSGAAVPNLVPGDLGEIVGAALRRAAKITARHRIEMDMDPDLPPVLLDPVLFEQVVFNLLDNAAKYAPADTAITLRGRHDARSIRLDVADEGPGIPPDDLERIFDSFYRVRKADHVSAGTGLGLSICRGFIEAMGGSIVAANRPDRSGAVLTVTLPAPPVSGWTSGSGRTEALP